MSDLKIGAKVTWFKKRRNRDVYDKLPVEIVKFAKKQIIVALETGERRQVSPENLQVAR